MFNSLTMYMYMYICICSQRNKCTCTCICIIFIAVHVYSSFRPVNQCVCGLEQWTFIQEFSRQLSPREKSNYHTIITSSSTLIIIIVIISFRLKITQTELDKMMIQLKEKQDALNEVVSKVLLQYTTYL